MNRNPLFHATMAAGVWLSTGAHAVTQAADSPASPATLRNTSLATARGETKEQRDIRMAWWRDAKFGMFIHWGLYAVPGGFIDRKPVATRSGEWIQHDQKIPVDQYARFAGEFTAKNFDAGQWVKFAQESGVRYIVITAKHHEGFAMYRTAVSDFNIVQATPFKRDPLEELATACRKRGIRLGFYYSQDQDWHHAGGGSLDEHWDAAQNGDFQTYLKTVAVPQVKELLTNYGPDVPAIMWFDTPWHMTPETTALFRPLLAQKPYLITNSRLGRGFAGDLQTPEGFIPAKGYPDKDWETCMRVGDTWGFKANAKDLKSAKTLIFNLIDIVSKGGNYLLNVGPNAEGEITPPEEERFQAIGRWLRVNGEAIYGTKATIFGAEAGAYSTTEKDKDGYFVFHPAWEWRCTQKPGRLFIHILKWPGEHLRLPGVKGKVVNAFLLSDRSRELTVEQTPEAVTVELPNAAPDDIASVLCLEVQGELAATQPNS